jgi:pilus assembly protein CpaB
MKKARLTLLGFAVATGAAAIYLVMQLQRPAPPKVVVATAPRPPQLQQVLVAAHQLNFGSVIQPTDLAWQGWPKNSAIEGVIRKSDSPNAVEDLKGSVVRGSFLAGEPIRREKLVKGGKSGYLSAMLRPGYRAVAINIEGSGATSAGNFVLPGDHVDVIRVSRDENAAKSGSGDAYVSETLVQDVRVLAIGQNAQDKGGQTVMNGSTATLELDPRQAETVILAQRTGQLSLVLRSLEDSKPQSAPVSTADDRFDRAVTVVRAGIATQSRGK